MVRQVNAVQGSYARPNAAPAAPAGARPFGKVLEGAIRQEAGVRISTHARARLAERNISLGEADMAKIDQAARKVAAKGGRDALVVMDRLGLILDVRSRTVVTAIERQQMQADVFTNIDSAVFV